MTGEIPHFGLYHGEPILPSSKQRESMTVEQLQEKYPLRYKLYNQAENETENIDGISPQVIVRRLQMLNNLDRYITAHGGSGKARVLREKQLAVFKDTHEFLETGETEGFIEAPTGFGKTVLFSEMIKATDQRTLVVVPSRILVEQTYQALKRFNPALEIGRYYSDKKERDKQVIVTTYQSLIISCGGVNPSDIDLLILDEVHQSLTATRIHAVEQFANPVKLGFTATPEYTQDKRVANLLNNEIHSVTLKEAVETGLLCSFSVYLAETDVDLSSIKIDADGDYNNRELEEAINIYSRNKSAIELYKKLNKEQSGLSKAVTYCVSIKHAKEVARLFNDAGIRAEAIWSDQNPDERRRTLEAYKKGEIKVLTNVNVLTEGFDDPQAALCLNLRPTLSKVVAKQRGGRVLRLDPDNSKKHAIVVDYLDRNENKRTLQVTFAQVAEGARIINPIMIDTDGQDRDGDKKGGDSGDDKVLVDKKEAFDLKGLRVITNSEEVLRIVRELEILQNEPHNHNLEKANDTDFVISHSTFHRIFVGSNKSIAKASRDIIELLKHENPDLLVEKTKLNQQVLTCTDPQRFIDEMVKRGFELKDAQPSALDEKDFTVTPLNVRRLFTGKKDKLWKRAKEIQTEYPEMFEMRTRRRGKKIVKCKDANFFIEQMIARGSTARAQQLDNHGIELTIVGLLNVFSGRGGRIKYLAEIVSQRIETENPEFMTEITKSGNNIRKCLNQKLFIQYMIEAGATVKN